MGLATLARRHTADHLRAISDGLFGMERALRAGEALSKITLVFFLIDENCQLVLSLHRFDDLLRAVFQVVRAAITFRPEFAMISLPFSTFVPSRRTTSGTCRPTSFHLCGDHAFGDDVASAMMPPKMLTKMPLTFGSEERDDLESFQSPSHRVAPPPSDQRKLAGSGTIQLDDVHRPP